MDSQLSSLGLCILCAFCASVYSPAEIAGSPVMHSVLVFRLLASDAAFCLPWTA